MDNREINKAHYTLTIDDYEKLLRKELSTIVLPRLSKAQARFSLRNFNICHGYGESAPIELWFERKTGRTKALWAFEAPYLYHYLLRVGQLDGFISDSDLAQRLREVIVGERDLDSVEFPFLIDSMPRVVSVGHLLKLKNEERFQKLIYRLVYDLTSLAMQVEGQATEQTLLQILWLRQTLSIKVRRKKYIENYAAVQDINHAICFLFSEPEEDALSTVVSRCVGLRSGDYLPFSKEDFQRTLEREERFDIELAGGPLHVDRRGRFDDLSYHLPRL